MKAGVFLVVAMAALPGCAPTAETEPSAPPAAGPQPLLPAAYSAPPPGVVASPAPPYSIYAVAPAPGRPSLGFPGTMLNPYHPQWTIRVQ